MSTVITYNGVELRNIVLEEFRQTPIRDSSDTDQLFSEFTIKAQGIAHLVAYNASVTELPWVQGIGYADGTTEVESTQAVVNAIRTRLTNDRAPFSLVMENVEMLAATNATDARNGPKVIEFAFAEIAPAVIRVKWTIKIVLPACPDGGSNTDWPVISNRWSVNDDIDKTNKTSRTWSGALVLAHLPTIRTPHLFRHLCVPPLVKGWRRQSMQFTGEPSGLILNYVVQDHELACEAAPFPAMEYRINHTKRWNATQTKQIEDISVELTGATKVNRIALVSRVVQILVSRGRTETIDFGKRILRDFALSESWTQDGCIVGGKITVENHGGDNSNGMFGAIDIKPLGEILTLPQPEDEDDPTFYDPQKSWWNGAPWGTGMGLVVSTLAAQWQTPCTAGHGMIQGSETIPEQPAQETSSQEPSEVTWAPVPAPDKQGPEINDDALANPYAYAHIESELETNGGWVGLPLAKQPDEGAAVVGVQLHAPTTIRTIRIESERVGAWPTMLRFVPFNDRRGVKHWPLKRGQNVRAKRKLPDGQEVFSITAEYRFQLDREYTDEEAIPVGVLPWDTLTPADTEIPADAFIPPDDNEKGIA
jgi:hypothetical protein